MKPVFLLLAGLVLSVSACSSSTGGDDLYCQDSLCPDDQGCKAPSCDSQTGECGYQADNSRCFAGESCDDSSGECLPTGCSLPIHCVDGIPCTEDICNETTGECVHRPDNTGCSDDGVACTVAICTPFEPECIHKPEHTLCPAGSFCHRQDGCKEVICETPEDCDENDPCSVVQCRDNRCEYPDVDCSHVADQCNSGLCLPETGLCVPQPLEEQPVCDDGHECTDPDVCSNGQCLGQPVICPQDNNPCTERVCDPADGSCPVVNIDQACDDGEQCTVDDHCQDGQCTGTQLMEDNDQDGFFDRNCWGDDCDDWNAEINPDAAEICDLRDNNCDGNTDESAGTGSNQSLCGCLVGCSGESGSCTGVQETCLEIPGLISACVTLCTDPTQCPADADGREMACVPVDSQGTTIGVCLCTPQECPLPCQSNLECLPYGLPVCDVMNGQCTRPCMSDDACPHSMVCEMGHCRCPEVNQSCLSCQDNNECMQGAPCNPRPGLLAGYMECDYPCGIDNNCPVLTGVPLYCHYDPVVGDSGRCACAPEQCLTCDSTNEPQEDPCLEFWMTCQDFSTWTNQSACTAVCQNDTHCPRGWYCRNEVMQIDGLCIEKECHCELDAERECVNNDHCQVYHPEFQCLTNPMDGSMFCSMPCDSHADCPLGYHCHSDPINPSFPMCRCDAQ